MVMSLRYFSVDQTLKVILNDVVSVLVTPTQPVILLAYIINEQSYCLLSITTR